MLSTIEKVIHLKPVSIFSQIPDHILANIAMVLETVEYLPDQLIFQKGDPGDAMYVIVSGGVRVTDNGHELEHLGESSVFGELALLDNEPRAASVTATEDTLLLRLPQEVFHELLEGHSTIARGILTVLSQRLRVCTNNLSALYREP